MVAQDGIVGSSAIGDWSKAFGELHRQIGHRFRRSETRERVRRYLLGLLGRIERKNGWQMAEAIGERDPQGVQRLLNSARWDAEAVRDDLRSYVVEHLAHEASGVLIVDETGFLKKGAKSVGVARQYTGTAGGTVNCQVGVFLAYSSEKGAAFLDRALYLPRGRGRATPCDGPKLAFLRSSSSTTRWSWPRGCWSGPSKPGFLPDGWSRTPSTGGPTPSGYGWRSEDVPTR